MKKLSLLVCLFLVYTLGGCGKKEPAPAPQAQVQAPVEKPAPPPEAAPAPVMEQKPAPVAMPGTFTVQVAAWETKENAEKLAAFYNGKGYEARVEQAEVDSDQWFRVRIGSYDNSAKARDVADEIAEKYKSSTWLVKL
ncbi:MAG: hypothetical protein A3F83_06015 [Candidatus Glassbacteria bacterium RIFCSPLOWO2_12_FULL_58_11]|uniref:SPOR domain-containing protein n=2 Tax=Candidatus Glassiibacteriota TaxID=1817805 RepID=A0A1F5YSL9_9BACT|nr:MAG: hypothetical protein A2Z86_12040 [Candidatus Glassbacteria bacterium GWA2_58_10]OGG02967.1 MAG: hypothetical protein A3F83_06015 [Candidatus Glassbacteria bacterium RIFCSPLOWO2_12_FULL_58_11]